SPSPSFPIAFFPHRLLSPSPSFPIAFFPHRLLSRSPYFSIALLLDRLLSRSPSFPIVFFPDRLLSPSPSFPITLLLDRLTSRSPYFSIALLLDRLLSRSPPVVIEQLHPKIKIVFTGIQSNYEKYGYDTANNVTGIVEKVSTNGLKETLMAFNSNLEVKLTKIFHLSDKSTYSKFVRKQINFFNWQPFNLVSFAEYETFEE
ncbi:MAG: hypothetical protein AB4426_08865, partial [Xenococcaceae cyanobacterium]